MEPSDLTDDNSQSPPSSPNAQIPTSPSAEDLISHRLMMKDYMPIPELDTFDSSGIGTATYSESDPAARISAERELRRRAIRKLRLQGKKVPLNLLMEEEEDLEKLLRENPLEGTLRGLAPGELPPAGRAGERVSLEELDFSLVTLLDFLERENVQREVKRRFRRFLSSYRTVDNNDNNETDILKEDYENENFLIKEENLNEKSKKSKKNSFYGEKIAEMCAENRRSLSVSYIHLSELEPLLAMWLADEPEMILRLFDAELNSVVTILYPYYLSNIVEDLSLRISDLPVVDELRNLRQTHLNGLVRVSGVVTKRSSLNPRLKLVRFNCRNCRALAPIVHNAFPSSNSSSVVNVGPNNMNYRNTANRGQRNALSNILRNLLSGLRCEVCDGTSFEINKSLTVYENTQMVNIQEPPGSIPAGRIPRNIEVSVESDLVDFVRPGELIDVTGIYRNVYNRKLNQQYGFPVFSTQIKANNIVSKMGEKASDLLTEEDIKEIRKLSKKRNILDLLVRSFAPSIYGHNKVKRAILLSLVAGVSKDFGSSDISENENISNNFSANQNSSFSSNFKQANIQSTNHSKRSSSVRIRGDINVLLIGDPGTAKSQLLKYAQKIAYRSVYTSGRGSSAVGLTASVRSDPLTKEWTLEGGALVLADRGICLIDEFDKMSEQDRTSIHEAMEQQTISISKVGIVTTLSARCGVIAASNPFKGYYDSSLSVARNSGLSDAVLSRFDIICSIRDEINPVEDERLAAEVVGSHKGASFSDDVKDFVGKEIKEEENNIEEELLEQETLRKYLFYCRTSTKPLLRKIKKDKIARLYTAMRREAAAISGSIPIAVRHIESIIRIAESFAKLKLRDFVEEDDLNRSIQVVLESFIDGQKFGVKKILRKRFEKFLNYRIDEDEILLHLLNGMVREKLHLEGFLGSYGNGKGNKEKKEKGEKKGERENFVEIEEEEVARKGRDMEIFGIKGFLESDIFRQNGYKYDKGRRMIRLEFK